MLCKDCGIELDKSEEDEGVCDKCDFRRNYPELDEEEVDAFMEVANNVKDWTVKKTK